MRVLLFDWHADGHHEVYLRRFAATLCEQADVAVAASSAVVAGLAGTIEAELVDLGPPRPSTGSVASRIAADRRELDLLDRTARSARAEHAFHVYADHLLPALVAQPKAASALSLLLFRPRAHYPRLGSALTLRQRGVAIAYELSLARFRRRRDAHAVLTLDPVAAERWRRHPGAPSHWLPEPWVEPGPPSAAEREGCVLYGFLSPRKGIDRLARAIERVDPGMRVVLAGNAAPEFERELERHCEAMTAAGARVERTGEIDEEGAQRVLRSARLAVLPYRRHIGMSRVLVEAAVAGTPVLADEYGVLGHLVRTRRLGAVLDSDDSARFASALKDGGKALEGEDHLRHAAEELAGRASFRRALSDAFGPSPAAPKG